MWADRRWAFGFLLRETRWAMWANRRWAFGFLLREKRRVFTFLLRERRRMFLWRFRCLPNNTRPPMYIHGDKSWLARTITPGSMHEDRTTATSLAIVSLVRQLGGAPTVTSTMIMPGRTINRSYRRRHTQRTRSFLLVWMPTMMIMLIVVSKYK